MENENKINQHQIYDNAFLSGCVWHKRLMIPLVNEIFSKNIPEEAQILHEANEHYRRGKTKSKEDTIIKRITDALIRVDTGKYHIECESKNDGEILIRIAEYDMQIALTDAIYENYEVKMELPDTAVIFLRNHNNLPKKGKITYQKGDKILTHNIPFLKVCDYTLDEMSNKHLYLLYPFYLMRYEHAIKNTPNKYDAIENEAHKVYDNLINAYNIGEISKTELENIMQLCKDVVTELSNNTDIKERLVNVMGTEVLLTAEERGEQRGEQRGKLLAMISCVKDGLFSAEIGAQRVGMTLEEFTKAMSEAK